MTIEVIAVIKVRDGCCPHQSWLISRQKISNTLAHHVRGLEILFYRLCPKTSTPTFTLCRALPTLHCLNTSRREKHQPCPRKKLARGWEMPSPRKKYGMGTLTPSKPPHWASQGRIGAIACINFSQSLMPSSDA